MEDASTVKLEKVNCSNTFVPMYGREGTSTCFGFLWKLNATENQLGKNFFIQDVSRVKLLTIKYALNIPVVAGQVCDTGQVFAFACTER